MLKSLKRLAAAFLIAILLVGSFSVTSAEAASLSAPKNLRFSKWVPTYAKVNGQRVKTCKFDECVVKWNAVSGASYYEIKAVWTNNTNAITGTVDASYTGATISGLNYKHVYVVTMRAVKKSGSKKIYSPWSGKLFITPWPKNVDAKMSGSSNVKFNWNIIYGSNGYNIFMSTNPSSGWRWNLATSKKATSTSGTVKRFKGSKLKKYQNYYVRVITRRKYQGKFWTVPEPFSNYYSYRFYIYTYYK